MPYAGQNLVGLALDGTGVAEAEYALSHVKNGAIRAQRNAINAGLRAGRKQVIRELPQYINYAKSRITKRVRVLTYKESHGYGQLRIYGGPLSFTYIKNQYMPVRVGLQLFPWPNKPAWFVPYKKLVFIGRKGQKPIITMRQVDRKQMADWPKLVTAVRESGIADRARQTMGEVANQELGNQVEKLLAKHGA